MATEDSKMKKRKGAADPAPKPKKLKKSDDAVAATKRSAKALKAAFEPVDSVAANVKVPGKHAQVFFEDNIMANTETAKEKKHKKKNKAVAEVNGDYNEATGAEVDVTEVPKEKPKKVKKSKGADAEEVSTEAPKQKAKKPTKAKTSSDEPEYTPVKKSKKEQNVVEEEVSTPANGKESKKDKASKKQKVTASQPTKASSETVNRAKDVDDAEEEDDQTTALLAGFESSADEADPDDVDFNDKQKPMIPSGLRDELDKLKGSNRKGDEPGVVYVGRIPHGFYEHQMRSYFSQFGTVTRLRVSRNKHTGAPKHYAFIEFASSEVASIVAQTMNNYLLFGHILQCKVIPPPQVHPNLFKDANRRFKAIPRNKMVGIEMERGVERAIWEKRVAHEEKRRNVKSKKLKVMMDYEYTAPVLKAVDKVPKMLSAIEDAAAQQLLIEAHEALPEKAVDIAATEEATPGVLVATEKIKVKKSKKSAKAKVDGVVEEVVKEKKRKAKSADKEGGKVKKAKKAKIIVGIGPDNQSACNLACANIARHDRLYLQAVKAKGTITLYDTLTPYINFNSNHTAITYESEDRNPISSTAIVALWYTKHVQGPPISETYTTELVLSCFFFDHAQGFARITRRLAYNSVGPIKEEKPVNIKFKHVCPPSTARLCGSGQSYARLPENLAFTGAFEGGQVEGEIWTKELPLLGPDDWNKRPNPDADYWNHNCSANDRWDIRDGRRKSGYGYKGDMMEA
ncbi:hypothetical protein K469DRAFT_688887 [Zopfia rhizophila CBS 207.26]|uniref:RRM domain-containing protein n=1 Tax=Zopfia rhizophila CBS 207.26 TaxID=1314779 RepID=A0A6A6E3G4_9PEZI|nr:hypothetical protein K469DRAFT_688887 [Zopfia rhizophila CBS 207.26]